MSQSRVSASLRAVLVPGYGAGAAFYFRNLADLSSRFRTYAIDMLGTGMSGTDALLPLKVSFVAPLPFRLPKTSARCEGTMTLPDCNDRNDYGSQASPLPSLHGLYLVTLQLRSFKAHRWCSCQDCA